MPVSTRRTSGALAVKDVWKVVVSGAWVAGDTITLTVGVRDILITLGATVSTPSIANAIVAAWNGDPVNSDETRSATGDDVPEFAEATAAIGATTSTVLVTMEDAGMPLGFSASRVTASTGAVTVTNPTPAAGPQFWTGADNWDNGVTVYLDNLAESIRYDLDHSDIEPAAVYIDQSFTGDVGLPEVNEAGGYHEYRSQYLSLGPAALVIGRGAGGGSGRIKINSTTDQCALTVYNSGTSGDGLPAVIWKGTHAANALVQVGGSLGVAIFGGETATLATINQSGGSLLTGTGVTLSGALSKAGGASVFNSAVAGSLTQTGGQTVIEGSGAVAQLTLQGGVCVYNTTGTLGGNTVVAGDGVLDFSQNPVTTQVTNAIDLYGTACRVLDPLGRVWDGTTARKILVDGNQGADPATQVAWGINYRLSRTATA
jgi:hypothetical protein